MYISNNFARKFCTSSTQITKSFCLHNYHLFYVYALILLPINSSSLSMNCIATLRTDTHQRSVEWERQSEWDSELVSKERDNCYKSSKRRMVQSDKVSLSFHLSVTHRSLTTKKYSRDWSILLSVISLVVHIIYGIKFFGNNSSWFGEHSYATSLKA